MRFIHFILVQTGCSFSVNEYEMDRCKGVKLDERMDAVRGYGIVNAMIKLLCQVVLMIRLCRR